MIKHQRITKHGIIPPRFLPVTVKSSSITVGKSSQVYYFGGTIKKSSKIFIQSNFPL